MNTFKRVASIALAFALGAGVVAIAAEEEARQTANAATTIGGGLTAPTADAQSGAAVRLEPARVEQPYAKAVESLRRFFPEQVAAQEAPDDPASRYWALLVGINEYAGSTEDSFGSRQDAKELREILLNRGWKRSNILMITDERATASRIVSGVKWLASKTTTRSTVIFHYAGHEMPFYTDQDGDGEYRDVSLWATDNSFVMDGKLGRLMDNVRSKKMWIHFATCRAGGFDDPGMVKQGRVITYSSVEEELSYEDPSVGHSVMGWYTIVKGLRAEGADVNGDGRKTVEEAFRWARGRIEARTSNRQHPFMVDRLDGPFRLKVLYPKQKQQQPPPPDDDEDCTLGICLP